ncbi:MAG: phage tail-like protein [Myxococcota bacterium]
MNWKDLYSKAFPKPKTYSKYDWPDLPKPGPWDAGKYPQLNGPGNAGASSYPTVKGPAMGEGSSYPELAGPKMGEGSSYPELKSDSAYPSSSYPQLKADSKAPATSYPVIQRKDHYPDFGFRIEMEGMDVGGFQKVEGLSMSVEPIEYQHSNDITPRKRMGRIKVENVKLIKGYINTPDLFEWCEEAMKGDVSRKSISLILLSPEAAGQWGTWGPELCRYNLYDCWPTKWSSFRMDGKGQGALVEEIELVVESVQRA